jgi:hypothetical protein
MTGQTLRVDFSIQVSSRAEQVNVEARPVMVDTEQGNVSGRINQIELKETPLKPFSTGLRFPCALGACQELRHVLILSGVVSPPFRSRIPAMIANGHIDAMVDQELRRFIVPADGALMQNAGRLVRAPVGIYVGSPLQ